MDDCSPNCINFSQCDASRDDDVMQRNKVSQNWNEINNRSGKAENYKNSQSIILRCSANVSISHQWKLKTLKNIDKTQWNVEQTSGCVAERSTERVYVLWMGSKDECVTVCVYVVKNPHGINNLSRSEYQIFDFIYLVRSQFLINEAKNQTTSSHQPIDNEAFGTSLLWFGFLTDGRGTGFGVAK